MKRLVGLILTTAWMLLIPAFVLASVDEVKNFDLTPFFPPIVDAFVPAFVYVIVYFIPSIKKKIPDTFRPVIPMIITGSAGYIGGLVDNAESAMATMFIGALAAILYKVGRAWQESGLLGATKPKTDMRGEIVR